MARAPWASALLLAAVIAATASAQTTVTLMPSKDNVLYQTATGSTSNGAGPHLYFGRNSSASNRRAVLAFDVAATIPANATITSVSLTITVNMANGGAAPASLHRLTADWGEGTSNAGTPGGQGAPSTTNDATWIHRFFNTQSWTTAGGDFVASATATVNVAGTGTYTWASNTSLVADVQGWVNAPSTNFGWIIKTNETVSGQAKRCASSENPTTSTRPVLTVTYTTPSAMATMTGTGCTGTAATPFTLGTIGLPSLGNAGFAVTLGGGPPNSFANLFLANGLLPSPLDLGGSCFLYLDPPSAIAFIMNGESPLGPIPLGPSGSFTIFLGIPNNPALTGFSIDLQAFAVDPVPPAGVVASNALTLVIGP